MKLINFSKEIEFKVDDRVRLTISLEEFGNNEHNYNAHISFMEDKMDEIVTLKRKWSGDCFDWVIYDGGAVIGVNEEWLELVGRE